MNYEMDKKQLIKIILAVVIAFAIYKISSVLFLPNIADGIVRPFIGECIFTAATVVAAILVKKIWALKLTGKGLGKGLLLGLPMILFILFLTYTWVGQLILGNTTVSVSGGKIVLLVITALMVGISEELLIRGILINGLIDYDGKVTVSTIRKAIIISSAVFGALHIFNVFTGVTFLAAFIQALNAALMGIFFGTLYIRSGKNLWPCILIHALWDLIGFINSGMLVGAGTDDVINQANWGALEPSIIFVAFAIFYLRKKKLVELIEK